MFTRLLNTNSYTRNTSNKMGVSFKFKFLPEEIQILIAEKVAEEHASPQEYEESNIRRTREVRFTK